MSKKKSDEKITIVEGESIALVSDSREDIMQKLHELRAKAREEGFAQIEGGFIGHRDGRFETVIKFAKQ